MAKTIKIAGFTAKPKKAKPKISAVTIRENAKKDLSPTWDGWEDLSPNEYAKKWHGAMHYYNLQLSSKDIKPIVLKWMNINDFTATEIADYKATKDWRSSSTMGSIASCLIKGMPPVHETFNNGIDASLWLRQAITNTIDANKSDTEDEETEEVKKPAAVINIQARVKEAAINMCDFIEDAIDRWITNADTFNPKEFVILNVLKAKETKAAHARIIKDIYAKSLLELEELAAGKPADESKHDAYEQLQEGYNRYSKKQVRALIAFYKEIEAACSMLMEESKINRAPRAKKSVSKEKLVEKLKYLKTFEPLKLVSISPVEIIGAKELWIYNTKNRKLGKYIADEFTGPLTVKGTGIVGFNESTSIQKTIRKPDEKLKEFKSANKVALRTFIENINSTDTKLNGRFNEDIIILKAIS